MWIIQLKRDKRLYSDLISNIEYKLEILWFIKYFIQRNKAIYLIRFYSEYYLNKLS